MFNKLTMIAVLGVLAVLASLTHAQEAMPYEYGYVAVERIELFRAPSETAEQYPNFRRAAGSVRTVGRYYVMQGAILRIQRVNDQFGEIVTDSTWKVYEGNRIFVRYADLEMIDPSNFQPLGYISQNDGAPKSIVVDIGSRTVTLMEGTTVVYKGPAVMNPRVPDEDPEGNPRGSWLIAQASVSRDMPPHEQAAGHTIPGFPGVSWAALLSGPTANGDLANVGYWLHSSAWFEWDTMGWDEIREYRTGGCVSSPAWTVDVPGVGSIRPDVLVWRWIGGNPEADTTLRHRIPTVVRVFIVDSGFELQEGVFRTTLRAQGLNVMEYYENWANAPLIVPPGFESR